MIEIELTERKDFIADVAIVGLGPGGLAAALEAARSGKKVVAFTDRSDYIRSQRLRLWPETVELLEKYADPRDPLDLEFIRKIKAEGASQTYKGSDPTKEGTAETKDIEKFLFRKLEQFGGNVKIIRLTPGTSITNIGVVEQNTANFIQLSDDRKFLCKNILAADGASRKFAALVNQKLAGNIQYEPIDRQERYPYHGTVQLKLITGQELPTPPHKKSFMKQMLDFMELGWNRTYKPRSVILHNQDKTEFSFAGEIPKEIFDETNPQQRADKLKKWAGFAIQYEFGIDPEQLEFRFSAAQETEQRLQSTVFKMNLTQASRPLVDLNSGVFSQIGDARRTPNYFIGHGVNDAIRGGVTFVSAITVEGFNRQQYEEFIRDMDSITNAGVEIRLLVSAMQGANENRLFIQSIDQLITRLEKDRTAKHDALQDLEAAKSCFEKGTDFREIYESLTAIRPLLAEHKNTDHLSLAFRAIQSLFFKHATETKSARLLTEMEEHLESYQSRITR